MKIGVISDTHLSEGNQYLEKIVATHFRDAHVILHAGDIVSLAVLDVFAGKEVYAVRGNMDHEDVRLNLPDKLTIEYNGIVIGLIHGWGPPHGLEEQLFNEFIAADINCLVYGHTHMPVNKNRGAILVFNPGAPFERRFAPFNSVGILEIHDGTITGEIIRL